jgi:hypothetical protein
VHALSPANSCCWHRSSPASAGGGVDVGAEPTAGLTRLFRQSPADADIALLEKAGPSFVALAAMTREEIRSGGRTALHCPAQEGPHFRKRMSARGARHRYARLWGKPTMRVVAD